jgi:hypothetical protein
MTENKRKNLINGIEDYLEDFGYTLNDWEHGFLENISMKLFKGNELTRKQYDKLTDIIGFDWL